MTRPKKLEVAREIFDLAVGKFGLRPEDLFYDMLTFAIGAGDPSLRDAAIQTLAAITEVKKALPGVFTVLGVSNISFGLPKAARKILTSVFLSEAIQAGLDAAIIDAAKILPLNAIDQTDREISLNLLHNRSSDGGGSPLDAFLDHFKDRKASDAEGAEEAKDRSPEQRLESKIMRGDDDELADTLSILMARYSPIQIINEILVPTMRRVGELFGKGEMLLPFVLKSAEVMKGAVGILEPFMERSETQSKTKIVLATVQGDVHDIGKNLVDIILSNNGFEVINLGINMPAEAIIEAAKREKAHAIGLSGLLVKSAMVMKETMPLYAKSGVDVPILLGGAALTPRFVAESCVGGHCAEVVYCADAFDGLKTMQRVEAGTVESTVFLAKGDQGRTKQGGASQEVARLATVPANPFWGRRHVRQIEARALLAYLNKQALFRGRWGYRRGKMSHEEYEKMVAEKVTPIFDDLAERTRQGTLGEPAVAYGYFKCHAQGETLVVEGDGKAHRFSFPRQSFPPNLCIADFFRTEKEGGDVAGFFVVTLGSRLAEEIKALYEKDRYHDYLMLHGFAVELTDALAEHWHAVMRKELGIAGKAPRSALEYATQHYQGSRYGFGYPACPDLEAHRPVFELLDPAAIGVTLTDSMEMVPELTTSAIVAHHPQAKYFSV